MGLPRGRTAKGGDNFASPPIFRPSAAGAPAFAGCHCEAVRWRRRRVRHRSALIPGRPDDLLEFLVGGLAGKVVADGGADTGVATRQLADRGAQVVAWDPGVGVLAWAVRRTPRPRAVVADAGAVPLRTCSLDMICFAQSSHWVDQGAGAAEAARLLRQSGWWAAWFIGAFFRDLLNRSLCSPM
jgi:hypothetical protein